MGASRALRGHLPFAARVGQPFDAGIVLDETADGFAARSATGHEETGLAVDLAGLRLFGTPRLDGYFVVQVLGEISGQTATLTVEVPVSPDPWALWQDIPSDQTARFARPDAECLACDAAMIHAVMASRRGRKHAHSGAHREDHAGVARAGAWLVAAVADGAGSAPLSREGARVAVETALRSLEASDDPAGAMATALTDAAEALAALAAREARPLEDFATTLILGALRTASEGWQAACISVGDGLAALWDGSEVTMMMAADGGEFAGQTRFLSVAAARSAAPRHVTVPALTGFCLMTDGVSDAQFPFPAAETDPAHWQRLWGEMGDLSPEALLDWLNFRVQGEHDDRSIVILTPGPQG